MERFATSARTAFRPTRLGFWRLLCPALAVLLGDASGTQAAWTERKGEGLAISSAYLYRAKRQIDARGHTDARPPYRKVELRLYAVYGLTDTLSLGLDAAGRRVRDRFPGATGEDARWSEASVFGRFRLMTWPRAALSVQPLVHLPRTRRDGGDLNRDADRPELELRVLYGRSFQVFGREGFAVIEPAYRRRLGDAADQARFDGTLGWRPWPRLLMLAQSFNIVSIRKPRGPWPPDYSLYKAQVSVVRDIGARFALQIGGFTEYAGRNTGRGEAAFVAMWWRF